VVALARFRTRDVHAAEDVAADTWLQAALWLSTLRADDDRAWPWLAAITRNAAIEYYRPNRASEKPMDWSDALASISLPAVVPAEEVVLAEPDAELSADARAAIDCLPDLQREAVLLRCDGLSQAAIAARTGEPKYFVWQALKGAAAALRVLLADDKPKPALPKREPGTNYPPKPGSPSWAVPADGWVGDDPVRMPPRSPKPGVFGASKPPLPRRPMPHERDGRQPVPQPARPHPILALAR
jgi:RNA polymerase sigma-70 factor (ECF subfamily)